tara:strand:- start:409 stop:531 length:123 start_codon:yes stop_codon:yes gene_type:complete
MTNTEEKEDLDDLEKFRERENEPVIDFETFVSSLKANEER